MEDVRPLSSERGSVARKKVFHSVYSNQNNNFLSSLDENNVRNICILTCEMGQIWILLFKNNFEYKRKCPMDNSSYYVQQPKKCNLHAKNS